MFDYLVGQKVKTVIEDGKLAINDPEMDLRLSFIFSDFRYKVPGVVYPMDRSSSRTNIYLDEHGVIIKVKRG